MNCSPLTRSPPPFRPRFSPVTAREVHTVGRTRQNRDYATLSGDTRRF